MPYDLYFKVMIHSLIGAVVVVLVVLLPFTVVGQAIALVGVSVATILFGLYTSGHIGPHAARGLPQLRIGQHSLLFPPMCCCGVDSEAAIFGL